MTAPTDRALIPPSAAESARSRELTSQLTELLEQFDVPGAAFAFAQGDRLVQGGAGVLSRSTEYPVTPDSWFQIGSITKLFTATLAMQLADENLLALDEPIRRYLPEFDAGDEAASQAITTRHLLTHTSGLRGDYIADFGRGTDAVRRYVDSLAEIGMLHRPGERASYCNSGFIVLGLIIEKLRGTDYDTVLKERLLEPLGISGGTTADEAMLHRAAVGHVEDPDGGPAVPASPWAMPFSAGPAGSTPFMDPLGLVAFARLHLAGGVTPDGTRLLSERAVAEMQRSHVVLPNIDGMESIGASWIRYRWDGNEGAPARQPVPTRDVILGHDGGTWGQNSFLRMHPASGGIVVLLTNGPGGAHLFEAFGAPLLAEVAHVPAPQSPRPPEALIPVETHHLAGTYRHYDLEVTVLPHDDGIGVKLRQPADDVSETAELVAHSKSDDAVFLVTAEPLHGTFQSIMFPVGTGAPGFLMLGGRVFTRQ